MNKAPEHELEVGDSQSDYSENQSSEGDYESEKIIMSKDKQKFKQLKESKRRFLDELNERSDQGDLKQRMDILVQKAESLANFLLTKHKYKE